MTTAEVQLPPGFGFHPTDEELVMHYLCRKCASQRIAFQIIAEIDLYKYDPWDLPKLALFGEKEWYFFSPRDRKYPNGSRPNRAAGTGYWKATGVDKPIGHPKPVGIKKALVFYAGKAPKGEKTNWIMHAYRLADVDRSARKNNNSLRLDDWVLCRIYYKKGSIEKDHPRDILSELSELALDQIKAGLDVVCKRHKLPLAQIWIPDSESNSIKALIATGDTSHDESIYYDDFECASAFSYIQSGKAVVGRAFSSQETCFCKDVTLLSLLEYPLVPTAREADFTECFAICLRSKCAHDFVCVLECFLPHNEMFDRDAKTFLNMVLSTMKEQLPGFIVASGKELGQRIAVEVVKVSPSDELNSFEIGQPLPGVQSLQDGGETTEIDSLNQQSNLQNVKNNVTAEQLVPCSSHRPDSFNCERSVQVDTPSLVPRLTEEAVTVNVDVAHDDHIEFEMDREEMIHPDSRFEQPNVEFDITGNARSNDKVAHNNIARCLPIVEAEVVNKDSNIISGATPSTQRTDSQMSSKLPRIEKDHGITRDKLEEQFGKTLIDAAKNLSVSRSTLKRICREYDVFRWPHHKTRKVNHHASKAVAVQGVEPYVEDQERPNISRVKGTDCVAHERSPATRKACDSVMKLKVEYGDDIVKFKLTPKSTREDLEAEVEKKLKISLQKFTIKYQDEDDEWITIATDSDLRDGMDELRSLKRTTMRCKIVG